MKAKHILAVGAAGVTLLGASTLSVALLGQGVVYAAEATAKPSDPSAVTRTYYKVIGGAYGSAEIPNVSSDDSYKEPKAISGYKFDHSEPDNGGRVWVHYYVKDSASTTGSSANTGNNTGSSTNTGNNTGSNANTGNNTGSNADTSTGSNIDKDEYKWLTVSGKYQLYINNNLVKGWQTVGGKTYYFDENGFMKTGILEIKDKRYYLSLIHI